MQLSTITRKSAMMSILLLAAILVAAVVRYWYTPFEGEQVEGEYFNRVISVVFGLIVFLCCGIIEGKMLFRAGLNNGYSTLSIPIYGVLACGIYLASNTLSVALASLCFVLALYLLLRSLHNADEKDSVFFASLLLGTTLLLYPPCAVLVAVIPIAIFTLTLSLRQSLLMLVGYLLPIIAASYVRWYGGGDILDFGTELYLELMTPQTPIMEHIPYMSIIIVGAIVALLIFGFVYLMVRPSKISMLIRTRRSIYFFLLVTLSSLTMLAFPAHNLAICAIVAVPTTILVSFVLEILPNNTSTIAYWLLLLLFVAHLFVA